MTSVSQQASVFGSHREGARFSNQVLRLGPVVEKTKAALSRIIQNQVAVTPGTLFHKGQPCPTSSASYPGHMGGEKCFSVPMDVRLPPNQRQWLWSI